jgi:hypothetical protein
MTRENYLKQVSKTIPEMRLCRRFVVDWSIYDSNFQEFSNLEGRPLRLPYPRMFLEFHGENALGHSLKGALMAAEVEKDGVVVKINLVPFAFIKNQWLLMESPGLDAQDWYSQKDMESTPRTYLYNCLDAPKSSVDAEITTRYIRNLLIFLNKWSTRNAVITKFTRKPSDGQKVKAYDSYWTLVVETPKRIYEPNPQGGTHARPRDHWRSGHYRTVRTRNGPKEVFIEKCRINEGIGGKVYKDYELRPEE